MKQSASHRVNRSHAADFQFIVAPLDGRQRQRKNQRENDSGQEQRIPDGVRLAGHDGDKSRNRQQDSQRDENFHRGQDESARFAC